MANASYKYFSVTSFKALAMLGFVMADAAPSKGGMLSST